MSDPSAAAEPRYPIGAVSQLTGIPVDTLRAWERRYGLVEPERDGRGRLYSDRDVRKLRLLRSLVERGHAIGRLAPMSEDDLRALETAAAPAPPAAGPELRPVLDAVVRFEAAALQVELGRLATHFPPRRVVHEVVLPLLRRVGDGWMEGKLSVAQEHLASAAVRDLLGTLLRTHAREAPAAVLLFATPPGERHEFGILAGAMLAVGGGLGAVYLGPELPAREIAEAARRAGATCVVLAALGALGEEGTRLAVEAVRALAPELAPGVELWVGGPRLPEVAAAVEGAGGRHLPSFAAYEEALASLGARF